MAYAILGNKYDCINHKGSFDLVTNLDYSIEELLAQKIRARFPEDNIIGEEINNNPILIGRNWTIDPIDGTVNLANNIPIYGIQCSMVEDGVIKVGVIYFPEYDIMCFAEKGKGAYSEHGKLICSLNSNLKDAVVSLGDFSHSNLVNYDGQMRVMQALAHKVAKIRMFGAASFDFYMLAKGSTSAHVMYSKNLWDILPGLLIAQEAGAVVTNLRGEPYSYVNDSCLLVAANRTISTCILDLI